MRIKAAELGPSPPLRTLWRSTAALASAAAGTNTLYGVSQEGHVTAIAADSGSVRWTTTTTYLPGLVTATGSTVYAFQIGVGLAAVKDQGTTAQETTLYAMQTLDSNTMLSQPVALDKLVHFVAGNRLLAIDAASGGLKFSVDLAGQGPFSLCLIGNDLLAVSGSGNPTRWQVNTGSYSQVWNGGVPDAADPTVRAAMVVGTQVVIAQPDGVAAFSASNGRRLWTNPGIGNLAFAASGNNLYCGGDRAGVWAVDLVNGATLWDRQYLAFVSGTPRVGLAVSDKCLWVGALLQNGAEPAALWAMDLSDGSFVWQATGVTLTYGNGLPLVAGGRMYSYGSSDPVTAMTALPGTPAVTLSQITQNPNPLRGPMAGFNPAMILLKLNVAATISFIAWHERDNRNNAVGPISFQPGTHTIGYNAQWPRGWTDINQFGRLAFEIQEAATGLNYTQVLLVPVNTLPDIQHHWAKQNIEIMLFNKYIGGYPDFTFRPNNLTTRAEASTIIAKTLGLEKPSPGFQTKFTDIATHWARNAITALEEKNIIGGFLEPDGTYTFRPNLNMTRAQNAKILVVAYNIPGAPASFKSRFTDTKGHWAESYIRALEYNGFAAGFREADGTYTFRPEQNLTRAELSTLVVRILKLSR